MSTAHVYAVEFCGGPFDGYKHVIAFPPESLAGTIALPVNRNMFRLLEGKDRLGREPATSVAIYELDSDAYAYRYLGSTSSREFRLQSWTG